MIYLYLQKFDVPCRRVARHVHSVALNLRRYLRYYCLLMAAQCSVDEERVGSVNVGVGYVT